MVIAIDPGDLMKPYAKEMEHLCNIYDGSEHETARGYHLCQVTAADLAHDKIVPLYCEAYSSERLSWKYRKINRGHTKCNEIYRKERYLGYIDRQGDDI
jgi:hypothetical protein